MRTLLLLLAGFLLAGCLDDSPSQESRSLDAVPPTVVAGTGTITASGPVLAVGGQSLAFTVEPGTTLLLAEIAWDDPVQDIDLGLATPDAGMTGAAQNFDVLAEGGSPGAPDSPHSLVVVLPQAGDWQASAFANVVAAQIEYRIAITLFHGETSVPEGYSAL